MATTGFWPVKSRLKEVIDYAENPDKTIDKKYVDSDLYAALQYAADDNKTDKRMYVSGINCKRTHFTELHRILHKNFLIWRCQKGGSFLRLIIHSFSDTHGQSHR